VKRDPQPAFTLRYALRSRITFHASRITLHASRFTHHVSRITPSYLLTIFAICYKACFAVTAISRHDAAVTMWPLLRRLTHKLQGNLGRSSQDCSCLQSGSESW